jgi:uncharacterized protein YkwD
MKLASFGFAVCAALAACGTPTPTPPSVASGAAAQINSIRQQANLPAVRRSAVLDAAAQAHADDMATRGFFSHRGSNGSTAGARVTAAGYRWCRVAENISRGQSGPASAIEGWRRSPGHYRNMINSDMRDFGLANAGTYWVMVLAGNRC